MPSHNDRLLQRIIDHLAAEDAKFKIFQIAPAPGETSAGPPLLYGGNPQQRLVALEEWFTVWSALPEPDRHNTARVTEALGELVRLRQPAEEESSR